MGAALQAAERRPLMHCFSFRAESSPYGSVCGGYRIIPHLSDSFKDAARRCLPVATHGAGSLVDELHQGRDGDDAAFVSEIEQRANGLAAVGAIVQGALVHIHVDESAGQA